jgi:hypothetical protein
MSAELDLFGRQEWRCEECAALLWDEESCPEHLGYPRVAWPQSLAAAYREVVEAIAGGFSLERFARRGGEWAEAVRLAERWGRGGEGASGRGRGREMGRRMPCVQFPLALRAPTGEVVGRYEDEAAVVRQMLSCKHEHVGLVRYDPGGLESDVYVIARQCFHCHSSKLANGLPPRPAAAPAPETENRGGGESARARLPGCWAGGCCSWPGSGCCCGRWGGRHDRSI